MNNKEQIEKNRVMEKNGHRILSYAISYDGAGGINKVRHVCDITDLATGAVFIRCRSDNGQADAEAAARNQYDEFVSGGHDMRKVLSMAAAVDAESNPKKAEPTKK